MKPAFDLPLTPAQHDLWHAHASAADTSSLQCAELLTFRQVDIEVLTTVLAECIAAVPNYQLEYLEVDGTPISRRVPCDAQDFITVHPPEQGLADATTIAALVAHRPDNPQHLRLTDLQHHTFFQDAHGQIQWVARLHHLLGDGMSIQTFLHWVTRTYTARLQDEAAPVAFPFQATNFAELREYRTTCQPATATPEVSPLADAQPARLLEAYGCLEPASSTVCTATAVFEAPQRQTLLRTAREYQVSEIEFCTAVIASYVGSVCNAPTVSVGMPLMNRPFGQPTVTADSQVGVVPLQLQVLPPQFDTTDTEPYDIAGLTAQVHQQVAQARSLAQLSAGTVREAFQVSDPTQPLYGVMINYRPFTPQLTLGEQPLEFRTLSTGPMPDVEFIVQSGKQGALEIVACARIHKQYQAVLERIVAHIQQLATVVVEQGSLFGAQYLSAAEHAQLAQWNATACAGAWSQQTLPELIAVTRKQDLAQPARPALWHASGSLNSHELWEQIARFQQALAGVGVRAGDVVAIHIQRSPAQFFSIAACAATGITWVPFDPTLPVGRLAAMTDTAQPAAIISATPLDWTTLPQVLVDAADCAPQIMVPESQVRRAAPADGAAVVASAVDSDAAAYYLFTSGSTGTPKCVSIPQRGIVNRLAWMAEYCGITAADTIMIKTPYSFDVSVWEYLFALTHGIPVALASPQAHRDFNILSAELLQARATICHFVPSALQVFMATQELPAGSQWPLRLVVTSGEALETATAHRACSWFGAQLHNLYGPTEASIDVTAYQVCGDETVIPIGAPVWNTQCLVVDNAQRLVPIGVAGNLLLGGVQLALGYVGRRELTAARFLELPGTAAEPSDTATATVPPASQRWYHTGDLAAWHQDGQLYYHGRTDFQLKLRGQRIELAEIEAVLASSELCTQYAVAVQEVGGAPQLIAYVVTPGLADSSAPLRAHLAAHLPEYMIPSAFITLETLPTTPNGKLDRAALPLPAAHDDAPPHSPTEHRIHKLFQESLEQDTATFGRTRSFFELGGNSLRAMVLLAQLRTEFPEVQWDLATIFAQPTITALAQLADARADNAANAAAYAQLLPLRRTGTAPAVICCYPAGGLGWTYAQLLDRIPPEHPVYALQAPGFDGHTFAPSISAAAFMAWEQIQKQYHGPEVILVGWSIGGIIAQEAAFQGHPDIDVQSLHLLDAYPAEYWHDAPEPTEADIFHGVLTMAGLEDVPVPDNWESLLQILHNSGTLFAQLPEQQLQTVVQLMLHHAKLMHEHTTNPAAVPAVHYQASANDTDMQPQAWEPYVASLTAHAYPVDHPGIIRALETLYFSE